MKTLWFDPMRPLGALGTEPRKRRSPKGQNSPEAVLGNPSFSAKTKKRAYWGPFLVLMGGVDEPFGSTNSAHGRVWTRSP